MSSELDKDEKNTTSSFLGITYSEFDNIVGPTIRYCYPPAILATVDLESSYSDYAIVGKHLYMKTIAIRTNKVLFMNCCTAIDNSKYHRNTLLFSFGFILDREADIAPYETSLKKITSAFVAAEMESDFLFLPATMDKLPSILRHLYEELKSTGESFYRIDDNNVLALQLLRPFTPPDEVYDYHVPMLLYDKYSLSSLPWDLALRHILPKINGTRYVKKIAVHRAMDIDCVRRAVRLLLHYKCAIISDIFRFSNVYELLPKGLSVIRAVSEDSYKLESSIIAEDLEEMLCFCMTSPVREELASDDNQRKKYYSIIFSFFACLKPRKRILDLRQEISRLPEDLGKLNIPRLIAVAQSKKWIRRVHEYPCFVGPKTNIAVESAHGESNISDNNHFQKLHRYPSMHHGSNQSKQNHNYEAEISRLDTVRIESLDGSKCLDAICCEYDLVPSQILKHKGILVVYK